MSAFVLCRNSRDGQCCIMDDDEEEMEKPIAVEEMKEEMKETKEETVDVSQRRRLLARALDDVHYSPSPHR